MIPHRGTGQLIDPATPDGVQPVGQESGWKLTMSEEFDGALELIDGPQGYLRFRPDGPKWTDRYSDGWYSVESAKGRESVGPRLHIPLERQYYTHEALSLDGDSNLKITATRDFRFGEEYTSGIITSAEFFAQAYGYFEARIRLPLATQAIWPAFWMQPDFKRPDPMDPGIIGNALGAIHVREVDVMETFMDNVAKGAFLYGDGGVQETYGDAGDEWHVYGCELGPTRSVMYYDGVAQLTRTDFLYHWPLYVLINLSMRDSGIPSPLHMYVDHVRVWQSDTP